MLDGMLPAAAASTAAIPVVAAGTRAVRLLWWRCALAGCGLESGSQGLLLCRGWRSCLRCADDPAIYGLPHATANASADASSDASSHAATHAAANSAYTTAWAC